MKRKNKAKKLAPLKTKKPNTLIKAFRFFFPKDFKAELLKGRIIGEQIREGKLTPKMMPTWWIGKAVRKIIDPKHRLFKKEEQRNNEK